MKKLLLTSIFMLLSLVFVFAQTTVYISPNGTGDGSSESNPTSISSAFNSNNTTAGWTLILLDGTYNLDGDLYLWYKSGTAANPITIKAKNKHMAILKGNGTYSSNRYSVLYIAGCKHVIVDGLTVMHDANSQDQQSGINVATANGANNGSNVNSEFVTVKNCKVYGHGGGGIASSGTDHITIEYNIVYGNSTRNAINTSGISIYKPKAQTSNSDYWGMIIRGNICYENKCELDFYYNEGGTIYQSDKPTDGNGIILDLFDNDGGNPKYGKRVLVENNVCYKNGGSGIKSYKSSLARIVNNTCYQNNTVLNLHGTSAQIIMFETGGVNGVYNEGVYNNVCVTDNNYTTNEDYAMMVDFDMNKVYNNYLVGKGAKFNNYTYSEADFATSNTFKAENEQDAPKFQNAANRNFNLKNNSPLIGAYTETYYPGADVLGTSRPQGTNADIGAYEYVYVTSVTLNTTTSTVAAGSTRQLTATVAPSNASYKNISWTTSASGVATVSTSGLVTGVAAGSCTITATTTDGSKVARCRITVTGNGTVKVEAENGTLSGTVVASSISGYSGTGYVTSFNNSENTDKVTMTINAPSAGSYTLRIRYLACNITSNYVKVNSGSDVNTSFPTTGCSTWGNKDQTVTLNAGNNTIAIRKNNGSIEIDYIQITRINTRKGVEEQIESPIAIAYPNPVVESLEVPISDNIALVGIQLRNMAGLAVMAQSKAVIAGQKSAIFNVKGLKPGMYLLEVKQGNSTKTMKLLKQ
jgi:uncharacterized protein YjdB